MLFDLSFVCREQGRDGQKEASSSVTLRCSHPSKDEQSSLGLRRLEVAVYPVRYRRRLSRARVDVRSIALPPSVAPVQHLPAQATSNRSSHRLVIQYSSEQRS